MPISVCAANATQFVHIHRHTTTELKREMLSSTKNTRSIVPDSLRYIRSDVPYMITQDEIKWLKDNNILTIVDLRTDAERARKHCALMDDKDFDYRIMTVTGGDIVPESAADVPLSYVKMMDGRMDEIIDAIENAKTNVLYFCNAGKDRTGVVSAILLKRAGYDDEYIIRDYMKSAENLADMLNIYAQSTGIDVDIITPHRENITAVIEKMRR